MPTDKLPLQIRLTDDLHQRIKTIAKQEHRTLNSQMEHFLMQSVERYEALYDLMTELYRAKTKKQKLEIIDEIADAANHEAVLQSLRDLVFSVR